MVFIGSFCWRSICLPLLLSFIRSSEGQPCPNQCNNNGRCITPGRVCDCFDGFTGPDCSLRTCPFGAAWVDQATGIDIAHNQAECSNMGSCDRSLGMCLCRFGFEGKACERMSCPRQCSDIGMCLSMSQYAETMDPGSGVVYKYDSRWDSDKIYGCVCGERRYGTDCTYRACPVGDNPLTGVGSSTPENPNQFNEIQRLTCTATGGRFTLTFKGKTTRWINFNAKMSEIVSKLEALPTIGLGSIKVVMFNAQACLETGSIFTVEFTQLFGDLPSLIPNILELTAENSFAIPNIDVKENLKGTKESSTCSGRGVCDPVVGTCLCSNNFDTSNGYNEPGNRGDCGFARATIQYCPGVVSCSSHGECSGSPTYQCICSDGWTGADCSERVCPIDLSWFALPEDDNVAHLQTFVECAGKGNCDRATGVCTCDLGFTGSACERLACPGDSAPCNGNGQCLDMNALAAVATINGDLGGPARISYGDSPNEPNTWDALKLYGCLCDEGFEGYDCSRLTCPYGDDPNTVAQHDEQQIVSCTDDDILGVVVLNFRQKQTIVLTPASTMKEVKDALEELDSIGEVSVETLDPNSADSLCLATGQSVIITFLTDHGDIPLIIPNIQDISGSFDVSEFRKGDKEVEECSGRGLCDYATGSCMCFNGFTSSDRKGGPGLFEDCGYQTPIGFS